MRLLAAASGGQRGRPPAPEELKMIEHTLRYTVPAASALLPAPMASPAASAMLLLQTSE